MAPSGAGFHITQAKGLAQQLQERVDDGVHPAVAAMRLHGQRNYKSSADFHRLMINPTDPATIRRLQAPDRSGDPLPTVPAVAGPEMRKKDRGNQKGKDKKKKKDKKDKKTKRKKKKKDHGKHERKGKKKSNKKHSKRKKKASTSSSSSSSTSPSDELEQTDESSSEASTRSSTQSSAKLPSKRTPNEKEKGHDREKTSADAPSSTSASPLGHGDKGRPKLPKEDQSSVESEENQEKIRGEKKRRRRRASSSNSDNVDSDSDTRATKRRKN
eukprot:TRINITY_DN26276_c0_g1_i3.p1 TRINITY_DN26276_c0_g1~~TRINITY_DN26276_c0_g1_i3.p1  ORF type:complete len:289 (-),score=64.87 TRINITY_DN26276_c0_g1_i3:157-969(-)